MMRHDLMDRDDEFEDRTVMVNPADRRPVGNGSGFSRVAQAASSDRAPSAPQLIAAGGSAASVE